MPSVLRHAVGSHDAVKKYRQGKMYSLSCLIPQLVGQLPYLTVTFPRRRQFSEAKVIQLCK